MPLFPTSDGKEAEPPRYRSHKEVWALKIAGVAPQADGSAMLLFEDFGPITVDHDVVRRYMPVVDDYLVIYKPDGYRSISPRSQFEDGYERIA
jgi:hypothetical protein